MKIEEIKATRVIKGNIQVGSIVALGADLLDKYRVVYITRDSKAILASKYRPNTRATLDLLYPNGWKKVIEPTN